MVKVFIYLLFVFIPFFYSQPVYAGCNQSRPVNVPTVVSAVPFDRGVTLTWVDTQDNVSHYLLAYGMSKLNLEYGSQNIGSKGTTQYNVGELTNGVRYFFRIRAMNGCKEGKFSNTVSAVAGGVAENASSSASVYIPKLSIYKTVLAASDSANLVSEPQKKVLAVYAPVVQKCTFCIGGQLLALEIVLLIVSLFVTSRMNSYGKFLTLIVPVLTIASFFKLNAECNSSDFFCAYFVPLSILVYIFCIIGYKNAFLHKKIESLEKTILR